MSQANINYLLELWALSLMKHGSHGPFDSYKEIYDKIDTIEEGKTFHDTFLFFLFYAKIILKGDVPWKCFQTSVDDGIDDLDTMVPNWRKGEYDIWYRDPEVVVRNMIANPDFEKEFDVVPYVELDVNGVRRRSDFMSANFAW